MNILNLLLDLAFSCGSAGSFFTILGIYKFNKDKHAKSMLKLAMLLFICSAFFLICAYGYPKLLSAQQEKEAHLEKAVKTYTFYAEGKVVDISKIDLSDYDITYKDEEKIAIIKKQGDDSNDILFILTIGMCLYSIILCNNHDKYK